MTITIDLDRLAARAVATIRTALLLLAILAAYGWACERDLEESETKISPRITATPPQEQA